MKTVFAFIAFAVSLMANPENACLVITTAGGTGTGFVLKGKAGYYMATNQHVINGGAPHRYEQFDGSVLKPLKGLIAEDRDIVMYVLDHQPKYFFEIERDMDSLGLGEEVLIYGNSLGEGMRLSEAKVVAKSRGEIEVSGGIVPGNSGGPIVRKKTGKVIAVSTYATVQKGTPKTITEYVEAAGLPTVRFYGVRVDTIVKPAEFDLRKFLQESAQIEADRAQLKRAATFLVLFARSLGTQMTPELNAIASGADQGHYKVLATLTPSTFYPGTYSSQTIETFKQASRGFFVINSKPTAYIFKQDYQDLVNDQRLLYSIYLSFLPYLPQR